MLLTLPDLSVTFPQILLALELPPIETVKLLLLILAFVFGVHVLPVVMQYFALATPLPISLKLALILNALYQPLLPDVLDATLKLILGVLISTLYVPEHFVLLTLPALSVV